MKSTILLASAALLALSACAPLQGIERERAALASDISGYDYGMQPVSTAAGAGTRAHGWRYFSDPATHRAVVISPQGDYYLSRGKGLRWVAGAQNGV